MENSDKILYAYRLKSAKYKIGEESVFIGQAVWYNGLIKDRGHAPWQSRRQLRLRSFWYAMRPTKRAGRSYSGSGSRMDLSAPNVSAGNITPFVPAIPVNAGTAAACDGRNGHAPYTSASDGMVLGNVSVCDR